MSDPSETLDSVRSKIDEIDQDLHRLMIERTSLAREVWQAKDRSVAGLAAIRPAREAQMLRGFAKRHHGQMPLPVLWRIWRELIVANIRAQSPMAVHVAEPGDRHEIWDLARAHFGFETEMVRHLHGSAALNAAVQDTALTVLRADSAGEWAKDLNACKKFRIFDALPQISASHGPDRVSEGPVVYLAGDVALEPSGADTSVVLVHAPCAKSLAAAAGQGVGVNTCRDLGGATLLGVKGLAMAKLPRGQCWGDIEVWGLGGYADGLCWQAKEIRL